MNGGVYAPRETNLKADARYILTPKAADSPQINSPGVFGVRPGNPFLYTIPATGVRPMTFAVENLPDGLDICPESGTITGKIDKAGTYTVVLKATNKKGTTEKAFKVVAGEKIALTPPLGWNSWNCWAEKVSDENVRISAKAMVDSRLVNHGWCYINIDDTWQRSRGGEFNAIQGNEKFPDMKGLCDYIHSLGLKIGIYSTPWVTSYAGEIGGSSDNANGSWEKVNGWDNYSKNHRFGKYAFAENDAKQWAGWGIDYLKYDWFPNDATNARDMTIALRKSGRDIVYSLSNSAPFEQADTWVELSNCWRTTGDIRDAWNKEQLPAGEKWAFGILDIWQLHEKWAPYNGPGHWNDADMLVVGKVGWGKLHDSNLTADEQYTHISLWSLWAAPLLLGCPLDQLDDFTMNLLTNDEVLAVNQDPLGIQALKVAEQGNTEVLAKKLDDGSIAVGLFNRGSENAEVTVTWQQLGIEASQTVRDLWRQKDIGTYDGSFAAVIRPHGVVMVKITK